MQYLRPTDFVMLTSSSGNKTSSEFNLCFTGRTVTRNRAQTKTSIRKAAHKADRKFAKRDLADSTKRHATRAWDMVMAHRDALYINSLMWFEAERHYEFYNEF